MLSGEMRVGESLKLLPPPLMLDTSCSVSEPVSAVVYGSPGFGRPFSQDLPFHPWEELGIQKVEQRPAFQPSPSGSHVSPGSPIFYPCM